jgi:hypothetical protein
VFLALPTSIVDVVEVSPATVGLEDGMR